MKPPPTLRRASRLAIACLLLPLGAAATQTVYRCGPDGRVYADRPCADGGPPASGSTATGRDRRRRRGGLLLVGVAGAALLVVGAALALTGREDSAVPDGVPTSTTTISTSTSTTRTGTPTTATSTATAQ